MTATKLGFFLPGRYIGENVRLALDMIEHLNKNDLPGLMFLIDSRKAFDQIEWSFILKVLKYFNFGPDFIKMDRYYLYRYVQ